MIGSREGEFLIKYIDFALFTPKSISPWGSARVMKFTMSPYRIDAK